MRRLSILRFFGLLFWALLCRCCSTPTCVFTRWPVYKPLCKETQTNKHPNPFGQFFEILLTKPRLFQRIAGACWDQRLCLQSVDARRRRLRLLFWGRGWVAIRLRWSNTSALLWPRPKQQQVHSYSQAKPGQRMPLDVFTFSMWLVSVLGGSRFGCRSFSFPCAVRLGTGRVLRQSE